MLSIGILIVILAIVIVVFVIVLIYRVTNSKSKPIDLLIKVSKTSLEIKIQTTEKKHPSQK